MSDKHPTAQRQSGYSEALDWSVVAVAAILAVLQIYDGLGPNWASGTPAVPSVLVGVLLLAGIVLFFTGYWDPMVYLLGILVGLYVTIVWALEGTSLTPKSLAIAASALLLAVLSLVALYREGVAELSGDGQPRSER